jgi:hypothetical protein
VQNNWAPQDNLRYRYEVDKPTTITQFTAALQSQLFSQVG